MNEKQKLQGMAEYAKAVHETAFSSRKQRHGGKRA